MTGVHDEVFFRELCFQRLASRDVDRAIRPHTYRTINLSTPTMVAALIGNTSDTFQQFLVSKAPTYSGYLLVTNWMGVQRQESHSGY